MRYMLFAGDNYYPCGGMDDFHGRYATIAELVKNIGRADWFNVYDLEHCVKIDGPSIRWISSEQLFEWAVEQDRLGSAEI
jgi:hypothetical protein